MNQKRDIEPGKIGEMLLSAGIITEPQLREALDLQGRDGGKVGTALLKTGAIDENVLGAFLAMQRGTDAIDISQHEIPTQVLGLVSTANAYRFGAIPVSRAGEVLTVVLVDPEDREALATLEREAGLKVRALIAPQTSIYTALKRLYPTGNGSASGAFADAETRRRLRDQLTQARRILDEIERELSAS